MNDSSNNLPKLAKGYENIMSDLIARIALWAEENGLNPLDPSTKVAYMEAHPSDTGKKKKRREILLRAVGKNEDGETVLFTDDDGASHFPTPNRDEERSFVRDILLMKASAVLSDVVIQKAYAPEWEILDK